MKQLHDKNINFFKKQVKCVMYINVLETVRYFNILLINLHK